MPKILLKNPKLLSGHHVGAPSIKYYTQRDNFYVIYSIFHFWSKWIQLKDSVNFFLIKMPGPHSPIESCVVLPNYKLLYFPNISWTCRIQVNQHLVHYHLAYHHLDYNRILITIICTRAVVLVSWNESPTFAVWVIINFW